MSTVRFVTHPEVVIDPSIPIPDWQLSPIGVQRVCSVLGRPWLATTSAIFCSAERKAMQAAEIISEYLGVTPFVIRALGENDRSSTGYLPSAEFELVADAFFAHPGTSVRGWERAIDAQSRIIDAVDRAISLVRGKGDIAIVSHGAVGALLLCHLKGIPISRQEDQPGTGGGNMFSFDVDSRTLAHGWCRLEDN